MNKIYVTMLFFILITILFISYYDQLKVTLLNFLVVSRGIVHTNCNMWNVSDFILKDSSGINLYNKYKEKNEVFSYISMFGQNMYLVTNVNYIKIILDNSPFIFGVGKLKKKFFKSFMNENVGVSHGCPWKKRRKINEIVLGTGKLHIEYEKYDHDTITTLQKYHNKKELNFDNFKNIGKLMVAKIVFGENSIPNFIFDIFTEANSLNAFIATNYQIDSKIYKNYIDFLKEQIKKNNNRSLVKYYKKYDSSEIEIIHQIPHFIFPILGLYSITIPRLLVFLANHPDKLEKVIFDVENTIHPNKMEYVRKCLLETIRLNNPVITTFRTLLQDFEFDEKYKFKKGTQFLILNNPVLREKEFFKNPNQFIPERWNLEIEKSYYSISFNQGPQRCPGKDLVIYLTQLFIYHFVKTYNINKNNIYKTMKLDKNNIPQMINPCKIKITF